MLGTAWTAPQAGDWVADLAAAFETVPTCKGAGLFAPTNLRLTGHPIQEYDRDRLKACYCGPPENGYHPFR